MVKGSRDIPMVIPISASLSSEKHTAKPYTHGRTERFTMENGIRESSRDMVSGKESRMTLTLESGPPQKHMGMVFIIGPMEIDTKDSGTCV